RSLTLENLTIDFDLRFSPMEHASAKAFVEAYGAELRQNYPPVVGCCNGAAFPLAPFSAPLGQQMTGLDYVWVLAGGRRSNGAHQPNEHIAIEQIRQHRELILAFIESE